jgi:2-dehydropantoate 2-reductase
MTISEKVDLYEKYCSSLDSRSKEIRHMSPKETIYILGCGAIGFPLAAYLANGGRTVVAVRTSRKDVPQGTVTVTVHNGANRISMPVGTISLSRLAGLDGTIVITAKSYANKAIALELKDKAATGPIVIMQNGVGVEKPFLEAHFSPIYRGILYVTGQATSEYDFTFRPVTSSPIGIVNGNEAGLKKCVEDLTTDGFPFRSEANIQRETWKKAIINAVFNSICPLLDVDNGVFVRDEETANLAREVVRECVMLTDRLNLGLSESELMEQIVRISQGSDGQLISTLQDIRSGRQTEIEFLNLEIARVAASMQPGLHLPRTELLGKMILAKSLQQRRKEPYGREFSG